MLQPKGIVDGQRRICYVNFASHLLNAYNPNMLYLNLPNRWPDEGWFRFIDMLVDMRFNVFEFWLEPRLFARDTLEGELGRAFARQMNAIIAYAHTRGIAVEMLCSLTTVGSDWHTHCPHVAEEWGEVRWLWDAWSKRLPDLDIVAIFPGDPGGCSRNGCTAETYIDGALEVSEILRRNNPAVGIELGTWGSPIFAWGLIEGPRGWRGEFIPSIQGSGWRFDKRRADAAMQHLIRCLAQFPQGTYVSINLGFNPDGNPVGDQDARPWAQEIAKTNPILTWDYSLTEGENAVYPHYRFERLFRRRREERAAAPYQGGICYTMTPRLSQLALYESAQSFLDPEGNFQIIAEQFFERLFGPQGRAIVAYLPLFEVVPDWGFYGQTDFQRGPYHAQMSQAVDLLESLAGQEHDDLPFYPTPRAFREELLFFARLFADLSAPHPDLGELRQRYWKRVYAIYDALPAHVDPRPHMATDKLVGFFRGK